MNSVEMHPTRCAICNVENDSVQLYPAKLDNKAFNPAVFSARRLPDRIHYRIVKCRRCGLVRSDPIANPEIIESLYRESLFDYSDEVQNIKRTYSRYLNKLQNYGVSKGALLEIGCGDGFFLEEALGRGYKTVRGVEPSARAVKMSKTHIQGRIVCDIMRPGLFKDEEFDVICMFQVLDHITDPASLLKECFRVLRRKGLALCINHNSTALSSRLLREKSPIVDIEHPYLFDPGTMRRIFTLNGFKVMDIGKALNTYSLRYMVHLFPMPQSLKSRVLNAVSGNLLGKIRFAAPLGNIYTIARKE